MFLLPPVLFKGKTLNFTAYPFSVLGHTHTLRCKKDMEDRALQQKSMISKISLVLSVPKNGSVPRLHIQVSSIKRDVGSWMAVLPCLTQLAFDVVVLVVVVVAALVVIVLSDLVVALTILVVQSHLRLLK